MVSILEKINDFGASVVLLCFILVLLIIVNFDDLIKKVKKTLGLVDIDEIKEREFIERIEKLEKRIEAVDKKVDDTSGMYNNKLEGFHQQSIKIRGDLADDIVEVKNTQDEIKDVLKDFKKMFIDNEIDTIRWEILSFCSQICNGREFSKEHYDHVFEVRRRYETILQENGLENGRVDMSMKIITKRYEELLENGFN